MLDPIAVLRLTLADRPKGTFNAVSPNTKQCGLLDLDVFEVVLNKGHEYSWLQRAQILRLSAQILQELLQLGLALG